MAASTKWIELMFENVKAAVIESGYSRTVTNRDVTETLTGENLHLEKGSPTKYGRAYRLYLLGPFGAHYTFPIEYLGCTREEAFQTLKGLYHGLTLTTCD